MLSFVVNSMSTLQQFRTTSTSPWDKTRAAHLLNRATFGATPEDIDRAVGWGMERTVDYLVDFGKVHDSFSPPDTPEVPEFPKRMFAGLSDDEKKKKRREFGRANRDAIEETRAWWIRRMLKSERPLQEKMTLFWHSHFATGANDVKSARLMLKQNEFLRANCLGNFRDLLVGISRDPAMLRYLDNNTNRRQHPNENYARELMELFTMGIGNYTEDDVKGAARAFTGWTFRGETFTFAKFQHDEGVKTFLGHTGNLDGTSIIDSILEQKCTAQFMAKKLLRFFVYDNPDPRIVDELASLLRTHNYEFKPVVRTLLRSEIFYSPQAYRTQIKSPAQLVVGSARLLGVTMDERAMAAAMRMIGQDLLYPPNVKGWDGGEAWINTTTLLTRYNLAGYLLSGQMPGVGSTPRAKGPRQIRLDRFSPPQNELNKMYGTDIAADVLVDSLGARLLQAKLNEQRRAWLLDQAKTMPVSERPTRIAHLIMSMPDYQLC
jgi:hypothetical protein